MQRLRWSAWLIHFLRRTFIFFRSHLHLKDGGGTKKSILRSIRTFIDQRGDQLVVGVAADGQAMGVVGEHQVSIVLIQVGLQRKVADARWTR